MNRYVFYTKVLIVSGMLLLTGCKRGTEVPPTPVTPSPVVTPESANTAAPPTPVTPSPTTVPLIAIVNGEGITEEAYQAERKLYQAASGEEITAEDEERILENLVAQTLLAQAAVENGFVLDESMYQERLSYLQEQRGGAQGLLDWMETYGYSEAGFRSTLSRAIAAAWMRDQIASGVPAAADQVQARQILLYTAEEANQVFTQLQAGNDFRNLAIQYDPLTGGDLGWFPQGYLLDPKLDEVAFSLAPGEYSPVIETLAGFHILLIEDRDPQRPLSPEALLLLQARAIQAWVETRQSESEIQYLTS